jgi:DNA-binding response OmpR family regulator
VLLDITMPHKGGLAALQELHEIQAGLPVILASGFEEEERVRHFTDKGWATFMQKPFEFEMLKARLDAIFARQARPEA